ncbi:SMP-30/gluconolactonase/LRE family protein [Rhodococcus sp. NPDC058521]|uniref:SMP-30/gluconolactonase/LRE family protein n=1 Tax=Rhodococcus sp. NPDC058521 TaxID=3346536 RepID=UPI00365214EE
MAVSDITVHDDRMRSVLGPESRLLSLFDGARWSEGPVWRGESEVLVWSDIESRQLLCWHGSGEQLGMVTVWAAPTEFINGNAVDERGRLVHCEHGRRCVSRTETDGTITVLIEHYEGNRFNSPNDLVVADDGAIWFSDPTFGIDKAEQGYPAPPELDHRSVYRIDPSTNEVRRMVDLEQPNGLAFSPDGQTLYVSDTSREYDSGGLHDIFAFDVESGPELSGRRRFAAIEPGLPDGLAVDSHGWVWTSSASGVQVFDANSQILGVIETPHVCSNVAFGGSPFGSRVFITSAECLYAVDLRTP